MKKTKLFFGAALVGLVLVGIGAAYALRSETLSDSNLPADLSLEELAAKPLFKDLAENEVKLFKERRRHRRLGLLGMTERPDEIQWVPTMEEAIAKATAEDKPILLMTFVRENGNPNGDV